MKLRLAGHEYSWSTFWYICVAAWVYYKHDDCVFSTEGKEHKTVEQVVLMSKDLSFPLLKQSWIWHQLNEITSTDFFSPAMARCLVFSRAEKSIDPSNRRDSSLIRITVCVGHTTDALSIGHRGYHFIFGLPWLL